MRIYGWIYGGILYFYKKNNLKMNKYKISVMVLGYKGFQHAFVFEIKSVIGFANTSSKNDKLLLLD